MQSKAAKKRLDLLLVEKGLCDTRKRAQALIMAGEVLIAGNPFAKAGVLVPEDAEIIIKTEGKSPFVSRGGEKLEAALKAFQVKTEGALCIDIGASTGGFSDCLLKRGAKHIFAVDVGYGQISEKLRSDPRITIMDRVNARYLKPEDFPHSFNLCVIDVSFISLTLVFPAIKPLLEKDGAIVALIKPQFEAGKDKVGKGGIVKDPEIRKECVEKIEAALQIEGFSVRGVIESPIKGTKGNIEFLVYAELS